MQKLLLGLIIGWGVMVNTAGAARYPELKNNYVNDYAQVISSADESALRSTLESLENRTQVEVTVLTIKSVRDYDKSASLESFSTGLFNRWSIGNLPANNGVMLLVVIKDREVRIELGSGYDASYDSMSQSIIDNNVVPLFKEGKYSEGIVSGVEAIILQIAESEPSSSTLSMPSSGAFSASTQQASQFASAGMDKANQALQRVSPHLSVTTLGGGVGGLAIFTWLMRLFLRNRPRRCNSCGGSMQRLDEVSDDAFLDAGQLAEERLSSVDYDVWQCGGCSTKQVYAYKKWFSSYDNCPSCKKRTLKTTSTVTTHATYTSTGSKLVTEDCQHCTYHHQRTVTIPVKQHSSSSSSSSRGGGGSSSGGGASGRW